MIPVVHITVNIFEYYFNEQTTDTCKEFRFLGNHWLSIGKCYTVTLLGYFFIPRWQKMQPMIQASFHHTMGYN